MCKHDEETVNHLILHCDVARDLWSLIFLLFELEWVFSRSVKDTLCSWRGAKVEEESLALGMLASDEDY